MFAIQTHDEPALGSLLDVEKEAEVSVLHIKSGSQHREPIAHIVDKPAHLLMVIEEDAQVTIEITVRSTCAMEVIVEANASVTIVCVQQTSGGIRQRSQVAEGASITFQNVTLASEVEHHLQSHLIGRGATSNIDWIFYAKDKDHVSLTAHNVFDGKEGGGEITLKGVAENNAHVSCDGLIKIGTGGSGTDTYLTEDVLMLDSTAKVDAVPGLEILTNDVKASHSATVSKVTPEDLFYFASRGIDQKEARHMYVQGFLGDLTQRIQNTDLRESVLEQLSSRF